MSLECSDGRFSGRVKRVPSAVPPPPTHSPIRPVSIYTTCLIPKFFQRQDGILLFNLKYLKLTYFDIFLGFLWLSIMKKKKKKDKKIIRITTGTLNQKFLDLPQPMLCSSTNQNQLTLLDKRHYGGKVSHPKVDLIANPSEFNRKIVDYHLVTISRVYCRSLKVALLPFEVKLRLSLLKK